MGYTIKQVSEKVKLTVHTLRFYDKEGLLPFVQRNNSGIRIFTESDVEWLSLICCLKNTGMPLKQIKEYIQWCFDGETTLENRRKMLVEHRSIVIKQISELQHNLETINYKISHYTTIGKIN
jgi:DNA-binding transcriptional MerR regulator